MATTMTVPSETVASQPKPETKKVSKLVFDFETMSKVRKEAEVEMPATLTSRDQLTQFKDDEILKMVNTAMVRSAILSAKRNIAGASPANVWKFIASFRLLPQFSSIVAGIPETEKAQLSAARKLQTTKIFDWIKSIPALLEQVQSLGGDDEDDEENDSDQE